MVSEEVVTTTTVVSGSSVPEDHPAHPSTTGGTTSTAPADESTGGGTTATETDASGRTFEVLEASDLPLSQPLQVCEGTNSSTWYRGEIRAARYGANQRTVNWVRVEQ